MTKRVQNGTLMNVVSEICDD